MEEKEIWKDIEGFEGLYQVSNMGNVKSLNYNHTGKERIMKPQKSSNGYLQVKLWKDGKAKRYLVHRLVANAFLDNSDNLPEVNHKDENKENNHVDNLEFCSRSYNCSYNGRAERIAEKNKKPIYSINKVSGLIMYWNSAKEASRVLGIAKSHICNCLKGRKKSAGNFYWYYADTTE